MHCKRRKAETQKEEAHGRQMEEEEKGGGEQQIYTQKTVVS